MEIIMRAFTKLATLTMALAFTSATVFAHCQVPCGIYGDLNRFVTIGEHLTTIETSMTQIGELSTKPGENMNQLVRWVNNKDEHADKIANIISYYFLAQRIKEPTSDEAASQKKYSASLNLLHRMTVEAMKCKQTTDIEHVNKLRGALEEFATVYLSADDLKLLNEL